jgi:AcrR family transcriptional regulator
LGTLKAVPKLWTETIEEHHRAVRHATLEAAVALVEKNGLRSVTMSQIASETGIGRATLYKYFKNVEAILLAWHESHVNAHLHHLTSLGQQPGTPLKRLETVLEAYALIQHRLRLARGSELSTFLHQDKRVAGAQQHLRKVLNGLIAEGIASRVLREDVSADELASYCQSALGAAVNLHSRAAVHRLVKVILTGLRR